MRQHPTSFALPLLTALLLLPSSAFGYTFATDTGDEDGDPLHWDSEDRPVKFTQHVLGGGDLPSFLLHGAARNAFQSWAAVNSADIGFFEDYVFAGTPCPHAIPSDDEALIQEVCGGPIPEHDFRSALYFIETRWPFGPEVIALTTLSWAEGARLVDSDIAFNALDYDWSVLSDDVKVDYESIALHEIGHFVGLGHSPEPGAVMRIDYQEGTVVRDLGEDDIAGLGELYPCSGVCVDGVGHLEASSCSAASGRTGLLALLAGLGLAGLLRLRRRRDRAGLLVGLLAAGLLLPHAATSSTVAALSVDGLALRSDRVVRARVTAAEPYRDRLVRSRVKLEVLEDWRGSGDATVVLDQPGGVLPDGGTIVFGMPRFVEGDEVVLFLGDGPLGPRVVGLAQGAFRVEAGGRLTRDVSGLMLARVGDEPPPEVEAPASLDELRELLRR